MNPSFTFPEHFHAKKQNWLKRWFWRNVFKLTCKIGRHDYSAYLLENDCAWLACTSCPSRKKSFAPHINTKLH